MIENPVGAVAVLLLLVALVQAASTKPWLRLLFAFLPAVFYIYFLPCLASTLGVIPAANPAYKAVVTHVLPASLVLLLVSADLRVIVQLGRPALLMWAAGAVGIVLGGPLAILIFNRWLPPDAWSGMGAMSGAWLGGSSNMVAVKASIGTPESVFAPMLVVDVVVGYGWMAVLMALAGQQARYDRWNRSDTSVVERIAARLNEPARAVRHALSTRYLLLMALLAAGGGEACGLLARVLPVVPGVISSYTWTILLASTLGAVLSLTPARRLEAHRSSEVGYALLYLVLASIGARADLAAFTRAPLLMAAGMVWISFHAALLLVASRLLRTPLFLLATGSQACVGGTVSAPVVAAAYQPGMAQVGLALAVLGNLAGTYLGVLCAMLCKLAAGV